MRKLNVGIVGCGFIANKWHIPCFLRLKENIKVQAVCDLNKSLASSVAEKFKIPMVYSDISDMIKKEELDIVDICTPPQVHMPLAIEAMEGGCHILLEKPMALKVSDCDQMIDVAEKGNLKLCVMHNEIFRPPLMKAKELLEKGDIGKLTGMQWTRFTNKSEYLSLKNHWIHKLPGGILGETGPHSVYTSLSFIKNIKNVDVYAKNNLEYPWAPYDYFNIILEGENANSSIIISHSNDNYIADVVLYGTKEALKINLQTMMLKRYKINETKIYPLAVSQLKEVYQTMNNLISNAAKVMFKGQYLSIALGFAPLIENFVQSVIHDKKPPVTAEEGRDTVKVMELIVNNLNRKYGNA